MLAFLMLLCGVSAFDPGFHFMTQPRIFHRSEDVCQMCYGHFDCLAISKAECDYKAEADAIFKEDEEEVIRNESVKSDVDIMMYDLMLKESLHVDFKECIPLISSYTDCHKGNICTGCTKCDCSQEGTWKCSRREQCRHEHVSVNHRVLALVMENLRESSDPPSRHKRSVKIAKDKYFKFTPEALSEWLYGGQLLMTSETSPKTISRKSRESKEHNDTRQVRKDINNTKEPIKKTTKEMTSNIAFDEVLREIDIDIKIDVPKNNTTSKRNNAIANPKMFLEMLAIKESKDATKPTNDTKVFSIDTENLINSVPTDKKTIEKAYAYLYKNIDAMSYLNFVNVKKRSIGHSTSTMMTINTTRKPLVTTATATSNKTSNFSIQSQIKVKVINTINKIIDDKYKEIELLNNLKDSMINFLSVCNATVYNECHNYLNRSSLINKANENIEINNNFRRNVVRDNTDSANGFVLKIKRDIKDLIKNIFGLRKVQGGLSKDLRLILRAISIYMKNSNFKIHENKVRHYKTRHYNSRRQLETDAFNMDVNYIKGALLNMIQVLDRDMPLSNALGPLSPGAKKVLKRVINNNFVDDSAVVGFRIHDPKYDMTTDLRNIGVVKWHNLTANIANGSSADLLYNLQLLYITLSRDIIKLREAFALLKFSSIRRMARIDNNVGIEIVSSIDSNLNTLSYEINRFVRRSKENKPIIKKMSLLKKIKNILSKSKNSILNTLRNKKPNDAAENNRNKTEEMKQRYLLETWQDPFQNNPSKKKRSLSEYEYAKGIHKQRNRMKNIIPHYLRGKVNPALTMGKGLRKNIYSNTVTPKNQNPVTLNPKKVTSTAKTKPLMKRKQ